MVVTKASSGEQSTLILWVPSTSECSHFCWHSSQGVFWPVSPALGCPFPADSRMLPLLDATDYRHYLFIGQCIKCMCACCLHFVADRSHKHWVGLRLLARLSHHSPSIAVRILLRLLLYQCHTFAALSRSADSLTTYNPCFEVLEVHQNITYYHC